jgi:hypothetical protein
MIQNRRTGFVPQGVPSAVGDDLSCFSLIQAIVCSSMPFSSDILRNSVGELLDVIAIIDAIMAHLVAETPEFVDNV